MHTVSCVHIKKTLAKPEKLGYNGVVAQDKCATGNSGEIPVAACHCAKTRKCYTVTGVRCQN